MKFDKQKMIYILRILFCVSLFSLWVIWLSRLPEKEEPVIIKEQKLEIKTEKPKPKEIKVQVPVVKKIVKKDDLPSFAHLTIESKKIEKEKKVLPVPKNEPLIEETSLRKKIRVDTKLKRPIRDLILENTWLPAYTNPDDIAAQIDFVGIINNSNNNAAIILNRAKNKTTILKTGEEYEGLKLTKIQDTEITLESNNLNKTYIKSLVNIRR